MNIAQFAGSLELGLVYSFVALGVWLSFRVLRFPDLTVDGSFSLGAFISAFFILHGYSPGVSTLMGVIAGGCAGWFTGWLSTQLKIFNLLSGILTMTALYSVNLRIFGKPNVALLEKPSLFSTFPSILGFSPSTLPLVFALAITCGACVWFFRTHLGLAIRATGSNITMAKACGVHDNRMICLGMALSNGAVALAGSLYTQIYGFADVSMGVGTVILGLASVILGECFLSPRSILSMLGACILGSILYWALLSCAMSLGGWGLQASDKNLMTVILILAAFSLSSFKKRIKTLA